MRSNVGINHQLFNLPERARQTRYFSLGTKDVQEATKALHEWFALNERPSNGRPDTVLIESVLLMYWEDHGKNIASPKGIKAGLAKWQEYFAGKTVSEITSQEQRAFRRWLGDERLAKSSIDRFLSAGRAALNHAVRHGHLQFAPHIFLTETTEDRESRDPMGDPLEIEEMARFFDAIEHPHLMMFGVIAANTLARPDAIFDLRPAQYKHADNRLHLNPPGRIQTKKYRPIIPVSEILAPWLQQDTGGTDRYINRNGKPVRSIRNLFQCAVQRAGLGEKHITPYSFRHGMARQIRRRGVTLEELGIFMGHKHKGSVRTTAIYAPDDPAYLNRPLDAINEIMKEIISLTKNADLQNPSKSCAALKTASKDPRYLSYEEREQLHRLLKAKKVNSAKLAAQFGVSQTAIYKHMRKLGVARRKKRR